jgi:hypothetical protein
MAFAQAVALLRYVALLPLRVATPLHLATCLPSPCQRRRLVKVVLLQ